MVWEHEGVGGHRGMGTWGTKMWSYGGIWGTGTGGGGGTETWNTQGNRI